jgi:protein-tyrosine phosphatase
MITNLWPRAMRRLARIHQQQRMRRTARHPEELVAQVGRARTILFVCFGNIIRSAFAAELLRMRVAHPDLRVSSVGLNATPNDPAHPTAVQCARQFGVDLSGHRTRRIAPSDVEEADLLLAMEINHVVEIHRLFPQHRQKVYLFGCLLNEEQLDVADPVFGPKDVFDACFARIERGVRRIAEMRPLRA